MAQILRIILLQTIFPASNLMVLNHVPGSRCYKRGRKKKSKNERERERERVSRGIGVSYRVIVLCNMEEEAQATSYIFGGAVFR